MPTLFSLPTRPTVETVPYTLAFNGGGTQTNPSGTTLYAESIDDPTQIPGAYFNPSWGSPAFYASNPGFFDAILNNAGTIWNYSTLYSALGVYVDNLINSGAIVAEIAIPATPDPSHTIYGRAVGALLAFGSLSNSGLIAASATGGNAEALFTQATRPPIVNSGTIAGYATDGADHSQSGGAQGIRADNGAEIVNQAGGKILAEGAGFAVAIRLGRGLFPPQLTGATVVNHGLIQALATDPNGIERAIFIANLAVESAIIENYGSIIAKQAIYAPSDPNEAFTTSAQLNVQHVTNFAGGVITGDILLFRGGDTLINHGTITGRVELGEGADFFDTADGVFSGVADLGFGNDAFIGSAGADRAVGGLGNDSLVGGAGNDLLLGGFNDDTLEGGLGNDGLYGETGNDVIRTLGGDVAMGGSLNDRIETGDYTFAKIDGGPDRDVWALAAGARIFDLGLIAASGRVLGIDAIEMAGAQTMIVHAADVAAISDANSLAFSDAAGDAVYLVGAWTQGAGAIIGGAAYASYTSAGATVFVQAGLSLTIGNAPPVGTGLDAIAGGAAAPTPGGASGVNLSDPILDIRAAAIAESVVIGPDETWQTLTGGVPLTATIVPTDFPFITIRGAVKAFNPNGDVFTGLSSAVNVAYVGVVTNSGYVRAEAVNLADAVALAIGALGRVINEAGGLIESVTAFGDSTAFASYDSSINPALPSLLNQGDILAVSTDGLANAVYFYNRTIFVNEGDLRAEGGDSSFGVYMAIGGGTLVNRGSISAFSPQTSTFFSVGAAFDGNTVITNEGVISAELAITINTRQGEEFTLNNSGVINGDILRTHSNGINFGLGFITNTGTINGTVFLSDDESRTVFANSGVINGDIFFGRANDIYDGAGGAVSGVIFGGDGDDSLVGGDGDDFLDGGAGIDTLVGGAGNDAYVYNGDADLFVEAPDGGIDVVLTTQSYTLDENNIEDIVLLGGAAATLTGNSLANFIVGNGAANVLNGMAGDDTLDGGAGADTLIGGTGNDYYIIDTLADVIVENTGEGIDTVEIAFNYTLAANLENLILVGAAIVGRGNALNNAITGNAANNSLVGFDGDDTLDGGAGSDTMGGGAGDDTYYVDVQTDIVFELAGQGVDTVYSSAAAYFLSNEVERLFLLGAGNIAGTGNDLANLIVGNAGANALNGRGGNDTIDGGGGADTMGGGVGNDTYIVHAANAVVFEQAGAGVDTVIAVDVSYFLSNNVENLTLAGTANTTANGNALNNVLRGNSGANTLNGGAGVDTMIGGPGDDTYFVDSQFETVTELPGEGNDTVRSSASFFALPAEVENLILIGTANINGAGNALNNAITGNSGNNSLSGGAGADTIDGGLGDDTMAGGLGDDVYIVNAPGDVVFETAGQGVDTVRSSASFYFLSSEVENLVLIGAAAIGGSGNALNNRLTGNAAPNTLAGQAGNDTIDGGGGADTMTGGVGDDTYYVDVNADVIVELAGGGTDTIYSSAPAFVMPNHTEILFLLGSGNLKATGNALNNFITGNSGANTLNGQEGADTLDGGAGADTMGGGPGDDTYYVDNAGDVVFELAGAGIDTVISTIATTYLSNNVENLMLAGAGPQNGIGNALANVIVGNGADNTLVGNDGNDTLTGGAGADAFVFNAAPGPGNLDTITDFTPGVDKIWLQQSVFAALAGGALDSDAFAIGPAALDASDRIIYNSATGALFYDSDGAGAAAAVQFAQIGAGLGVTSADFLVF